MRYYATFYNVTIKFDIVYKVKNDSKTSYKRIEKRFKKRTFNKIEIYVSKFVKSLIEIEKIKRNKLISIKVSYYIGDKKIAQTENIEKLLN
jgi:hypothetical protein